VITRGKENKVIGQAIAPGRVPSTPREESQNNNGSNLYIISACFADFQIISKERGGGTRKTGSKGEDTANL